VLGDSAVGVAWRWPDLTLVARSRHVAAGSGERWHSPPPLGVLAVSTTWWRPDMESTVDSQRVESGSGVGWPPPPPPPCRSNGECDVAVGSGAGSRHVVARSGVGSTVPPTPLAAGCPVLHGKGGIPVRPWRRICAMLVGWVDGRYL
jgi:hypothetical protein